ncbi:hypothetical protein EUU22_11955 [Ciceribacter ferrooxidans]|uniref:Uncharacterized protein n=1 Tax=Ciceribacter ferrooxidans TaxID=2509717 RepID=A0A4Q2T1A5_9HYPH|nr:hypothetical protein EUU22_11955 [Ciceribacter ferrooxidans]
MIHSLGTTPRRKQLLRNLLAYRALMYENGYVSGIQFLDGSFVEDVERHSGRDPGDIDVYSLLDAPARFLQHPELWQTDEGFKFWEDEIQNQPLNKARFELDTYALLIQELPFGNLLQDVMYWYSLFSHQKVTFAWKGFVAVLLDQRTDAEALGLLGGS